jgi:hypothetical protein
MALEECARVRYEIWRGRHLASEAVSRAEEAYVETLVQLYLVESGEYPRVDHRDAIAGAYWDRMNYERALAEALAEAQAQSFADAIAEARAEADAEARAKAEKEEKNKSTGCILS